MQPFLFPETRVQGQGVESLVDRGNHAELGMLQEGENIKNHLIRKKPNRKDVLRWVHSAVGRNSFLRRNLAHFFADGSTTF